MSHKSFTIVISILAFLLLPSFIIASEKDDLPIEVIVEKALPSVVSLSIKGTMPVNKKDLLLQEFFKFFQEFEGKNLDDKPREIDFLGSGFFLDKNGHILTNAHVIEHAREIMVKVDNDETKSYKASVIGKDLKTDIAVLKIKLDHEIPFLTFANSDSVKVGESVLAIGNAFGFGGTVTKGIISGKGRHLYGGKYYEEFLQTDASINQGNSGGPMLNKQGEVIGVNTLIITPNGGNIGIGFAIPSNVVKKIAREIINHGEVTRGWLGITFQPATEGILKVLKLNVASNPVIVSSVIKDAPAYKAGIEVGDVVIKFDGTTISHKDSLQKLVFNAPIGKQLEVVIIRKGKKKTLNITLEKFSDKKLELYDKEEKSYTFSSHGLTLANLTKELREKYSLKSETGVLIINVDSKVDAYKNLKPGDVIKSINNIPIKSFMEFRDIITNAKIDAGSKKVTVLFLVSKKDGDYFIPIELE